MPNVFQFVLLLFSFPCFEISHLSFKLAYALQHRRALLLCRKCGVVSIDQLGLEFDELPLKRGSIPETYHRLRNILCRLERSQGLGDSRQIGHDASLSGTCGNVQDSEKRATRERRIADAALEMR